jgi:hypothetical protein
MSPPPDDEPPWRPIALAYAVDQLGRRLHRSPFSSRVWRPIYYALARGELTAFGDIKNIESRVICYRAEILPGEWEGMGESDFALALNQNRERFIALRPNALADHHKAFMCNVRTDEGEFDPWLAANFPPLASPQPTAN